MLTILPEAKIRAVVFGSRIRMITAANLCNGKQRFHLDGFADKSLRNQKPLIATSRQQGKISAVIFAQTAQVGASHCTQSVMLWACAHLNNEHIDQDRLKTPAYLWIVFSIPSLHGNSLQVQLAAHICCRHNVPGATIQTFRQLEP